MAQITIQHGCGHDRVIETPGPEDPEGLLAKLGQTRGAVHRAPASKCPDCAAAQPVAFPIEPLAGAKRILLIDDEGHRGIAMDAIRPEGVIIAQCLTAAAASQGLHGETWDGLLLDHDLYGADELTGVDVAELVVETQDPASCKIFVHSQNSAGAAKMKELLAGFDVTVSPWDNASKTAPGLAEWLRGIAGLQTSANAAGGE